MSCISVRSAWTAAAWGMLLLPALPLLAQDPAPPQEASQPADQDAADKPTEPETTLQLADRLRLTGRYAEAIKHYDQATGAAAAIGKSRALWETGEWTAAAETLKKLPPESADLPEVAAEQARQAFDQGDYPAARQAVERALKANPQQLWARWVQAELYRVSGQADAADKEYAWFLEYSRQARRMENPEDLHAVALAAAQVARWRRNSRLFSQLVNDYYPTALKKEANYWPAALESGRLFLEKYNETAALKEFDAALQINPNSAPAYAAKAQLALENYDLEAAQIALGQALQINPKLVAAMQSQADLHMLNFRTQEAIDVLKQALKTNPLDEATRGRLAAAYGALDGLSDPPSPRMAKVIAQAVEQNPECGQFYFHLAGALENQRRYPAAALYYAEAHQRLPRMIGPRGRLGLMYMRLGDEAQAGPLLTEAFAADPFNVRIKNTLAVLDLLQNYAVLETEHFILRFDRTHDELLARYAARYLEEDVYPDITAKLGYEPPEKSLFEIFSRSGRTTGHGWFSARMVGLPYVHTVGACAGKMVAIASPGDLPKPYNWAHVLKHEFTHVVNLQQTNFNIPHWFTEALAVLYENQPRPTAWLEVLAKRAADDDLFTLETINFGFARPKNGDDWTLAYCQAELYAEYMTATYGDDAPAKMLAAYAANQNTRQAILHCFKVEQEEFERGYRLFVNTELARFEPTSTTTLRDIPTLQKLLQENPDDAQATAEMAYAYLQRDEKPEARKLALAAQTLETNQPLAAYVLARIYLSIGDAAQAVKLLEAALQADPPQQNALALLAALRMKARHWAAAEQLYLRGQKSHPHPDRWLKALTALYLRSGEEEKLRGVLTSLAQIQGDSASVALKLAQLSAKRQEYEAARRWSQQAMQIDIQSAEAHALLAGALVGLEKYADAIEEFETALELDPERSDWRFALADACVQAGDKAKAKATLQALLKRDASYPGAEVLLESLEP
ncbi:tetratricopeptide repeat protein [Lignipirellula cremea]|uniref:Tetratricopeptide repeat protein n=1 Tax=Lignipirellula cremea TaxID=2528010 RepID=A0A518E0S4_9BACT|nr:tetratricopeptide repeat protein [Lignipirellula cremea]QDU97683.1 tetratricopeptide repeat protein [Lignipirellula cremea]